MKRKNDLIWASSFSIACIGSFYLAFLVGGWIGAFLSLLVLLSGACCFMLLASMLLGSIRLVIWDGRRLISLGLLLVALLTIYFDPVAVLTEKIKADRVFSGICEHTVTYVQLILRDDGSSEYEPGAFLDRNWISGHWSKSGDTISIWMSPHMTQLRHLRVQSNGLFEMEADTLGHHHDFLGSTVHLMVKAMP